ncbi:MAG: M48 family metallopeptidase [Candidatus Muiribacteriota bacterium]
MNYKVDIIYKKIKNMYIRVKSNGEVVLTAPRGTRKKYINDFLSKKSLWIKKHLKYLKENPPFENEKMYENDEVFFYTGKKYKLKIIKSSEEEVKLKKGKLIIYTDKTHDFLYKRLLVDNWYYKQAEKVFARLVNKWSQKTGLFSEVLRIKSMKSRWGSCNKLKKSINLNLELIKKRKKFIEYIILHELTHLKYSAHDKRFYDFIEFHMADWKQNKKY